MKLLDLIIAAEGRISEGSEALWNCCFRYKDDYDKKHNELKIILNNIKHNIKKQSNLCC